MAFIFFAQKITKKYILPHKNPIHTPTNTPNDKINKTATHSLTLTPFLLLVPILKHRSTVLYVFILSFVAFFYAYGNQTYTPSSTYTHQPP